MYDIEKDLEDILSIDVSPSEELLAETKKTLLQKTSELTERRQRFVRKRNLKISKLLSIPAAAAAAFIMIIRLAMPAPVSYYTLDINPNISVAADKNGIVCKVISSDLETQKEIFSEEVIGKTVEYAIGNIIKAAQKEGYIKAEENILIGCFGEDEYNNISKGQILSYLGESLSSNISFLSVHGSKDEWDRAKKDDVSAGLYALSQLSEDIHINNDMTLDEVILLLENDYRKSIEDLLFENREPIIYKAPRLQYKIDEEYIVFSWEYIDYKRYNYDGSITYQLITSNTEKGLAENPLILDEFTFETWSKQPTQYTLLYNDSSANKYYSVVANYDDGRRYIDGSFVKID